MERGVGRAIGNSPSDPYSLMYVILISVINSEESRVYLTNAYFLSDPQLLAALKDANPTIARLIRPKVTSRSTGSTKTASSISARVS